MSDLLLPPGTRLLHIGPHKTGTTALQIALGKNREAMLAQGVRYVWGGEHLNANLAALAVAKRPTRRFSSAKPVPIEHWTSLIEKVNAAGPLERVAISGEEFCSAPHEVIREIVNGLDHDRIHVVLTLRPLEKIMASQWQQYIQAGAVIKSLEEWLHSAFNNEIQIENIRRFWIRHRHDQLLQRWVECVGKERISLVVLDEADRGFIFRTFEDLLGLKQGTLITDNRLVNRSMTLEEAESIRAMYLLLKDQGLGDLADHVRFMISPSELIKRNRMPHVTESRIELPHWALEKARSISREILDSITAQGVRVIGDPARLVPSSEGVIARSPDRENMLDQQLQVPVDLAGWTAYGVIVSSGISRGDLPPAPTSTLPFMWLRRATGSQLMREVVRRTKIRIRQPFERLLGRGEKKEAE
jgi:hypothetical protein